MELNLINKSRKGWVDALRGLAILLVMYGHTIGNMPGYFVFTSPFKMPLFFAITGYVFVVNNNSSIKGFFEQLFRKVFIPWMVLGLLPAIIMIPFKGLDNVLNTFLRLASGEDVWFMPCFFIGEIIWFFILRSFKKTLWISLSVFICFAIGLLLFNKELLNYAMFNRALAVQPFFLIGFLVQKYEKVFVNIKWCWIMIGAITYIGLCLISMVIFSGKTLDVHLCQYYNIPYCFLLIFLSCFLLFTASNKSNFKSSIMSFIGQNTLVLYIWHFYLIEVLVKGASVFGWVMPVNWWTALIKVVWVCLTGGFCAIVLNHYLPFAVGKKRSGKKNDKNGNK